MKQVKVLVAGGAGYIGSHVVRELSKDPKYSIVVLDNLSTGHKQAVPEGIPLEVGDIKDSQFLDQLFAKHKPDAVMHFCASVVVSESCADPLKYFENNTVGTVYLLQAMQKHGVKKFIFSSTAALFGTPEKTPIAEDDRQIPLNPYGESKKMVETILKCCDSAYGIKHVSLRYFNACGADMTGDIGEDRVVETHLIPLILQVPLGKRSHVSIFGDDYPTPDGTCVRDYIHVTDLATAHIKALEYLLAGNDSNRFNLGSGKGYSVKEIIEAARRVTGHPIPAKVEKRRDGDPAVLIASSEKAEKVLGWKRMYTDIDEIVASAWKFHSTHPYGFDGPQQQQQQQQQQ